MRFIFGESHYHRVSRLSHWHPFFAVLPRKVAVDANGQNVYAWLEWIEREGCLIAWPRGCFWRWTYREAR